MQSISRIVSVAGRGLLRSLAEARPRSGMQEVVSRWRVANASGTVAYGARRVSHGPDSAPSALSYRQSVLTD